MALYTPEYKPNGNEIAVLTTSKGTIRVQLAGNDAPIHVGNFVELSQKGYYDGLKFHRYVPGFVIQGGCPNTRDLTPEQVIKEGSRRGCGTGNPGYSIHEEYTTNPNNVHKDGTLAMAPNIVLDLAGLTATLKAAFPIARTHALNDANAAAVRYVSRNYCVLETGRGLLRWGLLALLLGAWMNGVPFFAKRVQMPEINKER